MSPKTSTISRVARVALAVMATAGIAGSIAAVRPSKPVPRLAPGLSFRVSSSTRIYAGETPRGQDAEVMRGRGVAVNGRSRIEFLAYTPTPQGLTTDDFLIGLDSGKAFIQKASGTNNYTPANDMFGGPAVITLGRVGGGGGRGGPGGGGRGGPPGGGGGPPGGAGGGRRGGGGGPPGGAGGAGGGRGGRGRGRGVGAGFLDQLEILDVKFAIEKLGAGEQIDGKDTQHYKITSEYRVVWGDASFPANAVTEIWTTKLPMNIPNPFEPLIVTEQSTDGPLIEYALKLRNIRAQVEGTPIKVVTNTTFSEIQNVQGLQQYLGGDPLVTTLHVVQQTAISGIQAADVDPKLVSIPDSDPGQ